MIIDKSTNAAGRAMKTFVQLLVHLLGPPEMSKKLDAFEKLRLYSYTLC